MLSEGVAGIIVGIRFQRVIQLIPQTTSTHAGSVCHGRPRYLANMFCVALTPAAKPSSEVDAT